MHLNLSAKFKMAGQPTESMVGAVRRLEPPRPNDATLRTCVYHTAGRRVAVGPRALYPRGGEGGMVGVAGEEHGGDSEEDRVRMGRMLTVGARLA